MEPDDRAKLFGLNAARLYGIESLVDARAGVRTGS
jgi:hypothetical protein